MFHNTLGGGLEGAALLAKAALRRARHGGLCCLVMRAVLHLSDARISLFLVRFSEYMGAHCGKVLGS